MINCVGTQNIDYMIVKWVDTDAEESLMKWGKDHGVRTKLKIASAIVGLKCLASELVKRFSVPKPTAKFSLIKQGANKEKAQNRRSIPFADVSVKSPLQIVPFSPSPGYGKSELLTECIIEKC